MSDKLRIIWSSPLTGMLARKYKGSKARRMKMAINRIKAENLYGLIRQYDTLNSMFEMHFIQALEFRPDDDSPQALTDDQLKRLKKEIEEQFRIYGVGRPYLLEGGLIVNRVDDIAPLLERINAIEKLFKSLR